MALSTEPQSSKPHASGGGLAERLRGVRVGTRQDLEVSRHLFRGEPAYVLRDPLTFQSYRLDTKGYAIFVALERNKPLAEIFDKLVEQGSLTPRDEENFYRTIITLHRLNFLNLPISDDKLLYQRHLAKKRARTREKLLGFLFLRIPLWNPDRFLTRTVNSVRFMFSRWFFALWASFVGAAIVVAGLNFERFLQPIEGVLLARNLFVLWIVLVVLKVLHEFGHAYACKRLGGHVPEMGVYLIVFTPLAYVDATSSWGFGRKRDRLIVCLAGMYFESIAAATALFIWAATEPGLVHDIAYNVVFLAGVATILFNINPLMRYDGYYALSDWMEIPNLRQEATRYVTGVLKRVFLGLPSGGGRRSVGLRIFLFVFGVAAGLYRLVIVIGISAAIATKLFLVGMTIGVGYVGSVIFGTARRLVTYLWTAQETAPVRVRAVAVSLLLLVGVPVVIFTVPIERPVQAAGVLGTEDEKVLHAESDGFLEDVHAEAGQVVEPAAALLSFSNDACREAIAQARARIEATRIRYHAYHATEPAKAVQEKERSIVYQRELAHRKADLANLTLRAPRAGRLTQTMTRRDVGRFVRKGDPVATVAAGGWEVRAILTEEQLVDSEATVGSRVEVRAAARPARVFRGEIKRIVPCATRDITEPSLTQVGGGEIPVDPQTNRAGRPYFEVVVELLDADAPWLTHGMTCRIRCQGDNQTVATLLYRRLLRFADSLLKA